MSQAFSPMQVDVLREVSNIGCGNAATALSKVLNKRVDMGIPRVSLVPLSAVADCLGGAEQPMAGVFFQVVDQLPCSILFLLDQNSIGKLLSILFSADQSDGFALSPLEQSAVMEVGNILSSAYLGALSDFTHLNFQLSVPALAIDMAGAILDIALMQLGGYTDQVLVIENSFQDGDEQVQAHFLMLPDRQLLGSIFQALGITE